MKVDLPQPESAARPMTMGVSPSFNAIWREDARRPELLGMKAEAVAAARATMEMESFMVGMTV